MPASHPALERQTPGVYVEPGVGETVAFTVVDGAGNVVLKGAVREDLCDEQFLQGLRRFYRRQRPRLTLV